MTIIERYGRVDVWVDQLEPLLVGTTYLNLELLTVESTTRYIKDADTDQNISTDMHPVFGDRRMKSRLWSNQDHEGLRVCNLRRQAFRLKE